MDVFDDAVLLRDLEEFFPHARPFSGRQDTKYDASICTPHYKRSVLDVPIYEKIRVAQLVNKFPAFHSILNNTTISYLYIRVLLYV